VTASTDLYGEILAAHRRIRPDICVTELRRSDVLSAATGAEIHLKLENLQLTGSFKARGAMNKLLSLPDEERRRGVVAASTGNHGAAVACCAARLGIRAVVYVTETAPEVKIAEVRKWGGEVRRYGLDAVETEAKAREFAAVEALTYISPYNDLQVIAGQGTIAVELLEQLPGLDAVIAPVGGGGLASGIGAYLKGAARGVRLVGCSPENSQVMIRSVMAGRILDLPSRPTLSEATAGGVERGAVTFDLCRELVDSFVTLTEDEIRAAMVLFASEHGMAIAGAAALGIAACVKEAERYAGGRVVIVISGGNVDPDALKELADRRDGKRTGGRM